MQPVSINATSIADAWFQLVYLVHDSNLVYEQKIQRGSFENDQVRRQFYGVSIFIKHPETDIVPVMPPGLPIPPTTDMDYIEGYFATYLMRAELYPNEQYTYGQRIAISMGDVIEMLKKTPFTNQAVMEVGKPDDVTLSDPPCLRVMDLKVIPPRTLTMSVYFRSWDLWAGLPANLGGFELLKEYIAGETGLDNGPMYSYSAGLHLYGMYNEVAAIRCGRG